MSYDSKNGVPLKSERKQDLLKTIDKLYSYASVIIRHPRTMKVDNDLYDMLRDTKLSIDESEITSALIRYYQNPKYWPQEEIDRINKNRKQLSKGLGKDIILIGEKT